MPEPFIPGVLHDHVTISHGVEVLRILPAAVQEATALLDFAGGMEEFAHFPDHIANNVCEIRFPAKGLLEFAPNGDLGFVTFTFKETDQLINALQQGVRMVVDARTLRGGPAQVGFINMTGPDPLIEGH